MRCEVPSHALGGERQEAPLKCQAAQTRKGVKGVVGRVQPFGFHLSRHRPAELCCQRTGFPTSSACSVENGLELKETEAGAVQGTSGPGGAGECLHELWVRAALLSSPCRTGWLSMPLRLGDFPLGKLRGC